MTLSIARGRRRGAPSRLALTMWEMRDLVKPSLFFAAARHPTKTPGTTSSGTLSCLENILSCERGADNVARLGCQVAPFHPPSRVGPRAGTREKAAAHLFQGLNRRRPPLLVPRVAGGWPWHGLRGLPAGGDVRGRLTGDSEEGATLRMRVARAAGPGNGRPGKQPTRCRYRSAASRSGAGAVGTFRAAAGTILRSPNAHDHGAVVQGDEAGRGRGGKPCRGTVPPPYSRRAVT